MGEKQNKSEKIQNRESWLKTEVIIFFSIVFGIPLFLKLISSELQLDFSNFNFESVLTMIVSFFAISLSVMFYFKATDSSNAFYNNSYIFTKNISEMLSSIQAGFSERLTNIDKGYDNFRKSFENSITPQQKAIIQKDLDKETKNIKEIGSDKEKIIGELIEKSNLPPKEVNDYIMQINKKEIELNEKNNQIKELKIQLKNDENNRKFNEEKNTSLTHYTKQIVLPNIPLKIRNSKIMLSTYFKRNYEVFDVRYFNDLIQVGFMDDENILTDKGIEFIRHLAES